MRHLVVTRRRALEVDRARSHEQPVEQLLE
jgi:hypothetical protein